MARLRLGVIGAGSWTVGSHLPALARRSDDVEFLIVNRRDPQLLRSIKEQFGFARAVTDWREVVDAHPDLVVVGSPAGLHYQQVRAALEAGAHVLCEKPFTIDPAEAWELTRFAESRGLHLVIALGWNYRPAATEAARLLAQPGIGEVEHLTVRMESHLRGLLSPQGDGSGGPAHVPPRAETWLDPRLSGGGYGVAQLSHGIGLALWLTGLRAAEVTAYAYPAPGAPVEWHLAIAARYHNGAVGTVSGGSGHGAAGGRHELEIRAIGADGQLHLDLARDEVALTPRDGRRMDVTLEPGAGAYDSQGPVDALVDLALGHGTNRSPAELGARTVELLAAAYRSLPDHRPQPIVTDPSAAL